MFVYIDFFIVCLNCLFERSTGDKRLLNQYVILIVLIQWFGHHGRATAILTKVMIQTIPTSCQFATAKIQSDIEFKPVQRILVEALAKCTQASDPLTPSLFKLKISKMWALVDLQIRWTSW